VISPAPTLETRAAWARIACAAVAVVGASLACAPRAQPLSGTPVVARIPAAQLPRGHQRITFRWQFSEGDVALQGEGVARVAAPDSARLDFFLRNGLGGGYAVLVGDSLTVPPGGEQVRRLLPPVPLLWAALGRVALPAVPDTTVRRDGRLLRADVGRDPRWRVTFDGDRLTEAARISEGREIERLSRAADGAVSYLHSPGQRRLSLTNYSAGPAGDFDAAIWRP
jgi:hypothetical protein